MQVGAFLAGSPVAGGLRERSAGSGTSRPRALRKVCRGESTVLCVFMLGGR